MRQEGLIHYRRVLNIIQWEKKKNFLQNNSCDVAIATVVDKGPLIKLKADCMRGECFFPLFLKIS